MNYTVVGRYSDLELYYESLLMEGWAETEAYEELLNFIQEYGVMVIVEDLEFAK